MGVRMGARVLVTQRSTENRSEGGEVLWDGDKSDKAKCHQECNGGKGCDSDEIIHHVCERVAAQPIDLPLEEATSLMVGMLAPASHRWTAMLDNVGRATTVAQGKALGR